MNKKSLLLALLCLWPLISAPPAQAMLGEDQLMLRRFFLDKGHWPVAKQTLMTHFAQVRSAMDPQSVQFFADPQGLVQREYWMSDGEMWTMEQALQIRDAIMENRAAQYSGSQSTKAQKLYLYADGSRVLFKMSGPKVFSILAISSQYDAGDLGVMPDALQKITHVIRPRDY